MAQAVARKFLSFSRPQLFGLDPFWVKKSGPQLELLGMRGGLYKATAISDDGLYVKVESTPVKPSIVPQIKATFAQFLNPDEYQTEKKNAFSRAQITAPGLSSA